MTENDKSSGVEYTPESIIKRTALDVGFSEVGIAAIAPSIESGAVFERWIAEEKHGEMRYLSGGRKKRLEPGELLEGARSAVCVSVNYYSAALDDENRAARDSGRGVFSLYAQGRDYHLVLRRMLQELDGRLKSVFPRMKSFACVDTQPISERDFAVRSGIGWLGKNTMVISPQYGSWVFLGELVTNLDLTPDTPLQSLCGSCTRCMDACPTGALDEAYFLDATKCISYLTIERRGEIPAEFHAPIGQNVFGCDECQLVCPFNAAAEESAVFPARDRRRIVEMDLDALSSLSDDEFRELTRDSAVDRCKPAGMRRNAKIVLKNVATGR